VWLTLYASHTTIKLMADGQSNENGREFFSALRGNRLLILIKIN